MNNIIINPQYKQLEHFITSIPDIFIIQGNIVQNGRNLIKTFVTPDGTVLNVKRYHKPHGINAIVYSTGLRKSKGLRAYKHAKIITDRGFETPTEIAYIEERSFASIIGYTYFISLQSKYKHKMYEWGNAKQGTFENFAHAFGIYSARLHNAGILHRDYTPGNVLWDKDSKGRYYFSLVDTNQMYFGNVGFSSGCKNICKFWGSRRFMEIIAEEYARGRNFPITRCVTKVMNERAKFWRRYKRRKPEKITFRLEL